VNALQVIQQQMLQAVLGGVSTPPAAIQGDAIAGAGARLAIYQRGYRIRLRDALRDEFSGLQCAAGRSFENLLDKYVAAHPSEHYSIRWYGSGLAAFLDYAHPWRNKPQLAEMARLDWAISTAFDAADESSKNVTELSAVPAEAWAGLCLSLQQNLQIMACLFNTMAFRRAADRGARRPHLRRFAAPRQVMVWRHATTVHYRQLDDDEWQVLGATMRGASFAGLCDMLAARHGHATAMPRMVTLLQRWLTDGVIRGWIVE
jgi:hypothetical protein